MNKEVKKVIIIILLWLLIPLYKLLWLSGTIFEPIVLAGILMLPITIFTTLFRLWGTPENLKINIFLSVISTLSLFAVICCIFLDYSVRVSLWISDGNFVILPYCLSLIVVYKVWYTPKNFNMILSLISTIAFIVLISLSYISLNAIMSV
jgi:hypothetical protein